MLGHAGKLGKLSHARDVDWTLLFCLRLAALLCRRRADVGLPRYRGLAGQWRLRCALAERVGRANNPLTDYSLVQEAAEWEKIGMPYRVVYTGV